MAYSKKTKFYKIPVMATGDILTEQDEMEKFTIIDNLLYAYTFGTDKCIIEEGSYNIIENIDSSIELVIKPLKKYSLLGILNYRLFSSEKELSVIIPSTGTWYCYAVYKPGMENDSSQFDLELYGSKQSDNSQQIFLAEITTDDLGNTNIITDADKIYGKNLLAHISDNTNPHGSLLIQDEISIQKAISVKNNSVYGAIYMSIISKGSTGTVISEYNGKPIFDYGNPIFITAYSENLNAGNISWKIDEIQKNINILNSGDTGVKINLKIEFK